MEADGRYEFGGPVGVTAMMVGFPALMCEYSNDGRGGVGAGEVAEQVSRQQLRG
jgi:hypothetical protein